MLRYANRTASLLEYILSAFLQNLCRLRFLFGLHGAFAIATELEVCFVKACLFAGSSFPALGSAQAVQLSLSLTKSGILQLKLALASSAGLMIMWHSDGVTPY